VNPRGAALACGLAAAVALGACGKSEAPAKVDAAAEQKAATERAKQGPFGAQVKALETAKGMGDDLNKKAQEEVDRVDNMK
jgi:hypothetical protein